MRLIAEALASLQYRTELLLHLCSLAHSTSGRIYDGHCRTLAFHGPRMPAARIKQQHPVMCFMMPCAYIIQSRPTAGERIFYYPPPRRTVCLLSGRGGLLFSGDGDRPAAQISPNPSDKFRCINSWLAAPRLCVTFRWRSNKALNFLPSKIRRPLRLATGDPRPVPVQHCAFWANATS